ncbi:hypothetical protein GCM10012320_12460 [Sinomonas cellulolyticus]|nr:hypothetical protein GCM10012320_12460 [Sinomonas sp. KCTC 49339]
MCDPTSAEPGSEGAQAQGPSMAGWCILGVVARTLTLRRNDSSSGRNQSSGETRSGREEDHRALSIMAANP